MYRQLLPVTMVTHLAASPLAAPGSGLFLRWVTWAYRGSSTLVSVKLLSSVLAQACGNTQADNTELLRCCSYLDVLRA